MDGIGKGRRLDRTIETGAGALFAGAIGFAAWVVLAAQAPVYRLSSSVVGAFVAYLLAIRFLSRFRDPDELPLPGFQIAELESAFAAIAPDLENDAQDEDARPVDTEADELLLDDIVGQIRPEARVIRLFDPAKMPTAGELQDRIDQHLGKPQASNPDSTRELYDALAALRQSLR